MTPEQFLAEQSVIALCINKLIKSSSVETNLISDGFHTFGELYEHRIVLYLVLLRHFSTHPKQKGNIWRTEVHSDGSKWDGWFLLGIGKQKGEQITYHFPMSKWEETNFAETIDIAPDFDGHTSTDVLQRLLKLF